MRGGRREVVIPSGDATLEGVLSIPPDAPGIVVFAHGSGSSRHSPRNVWVADALQQAGLATLLFDLLTMDEERVDRRTRHLRFDIPLLARRVVGTVDWLAGRSETSGLSIGLFGSSTGAAAALVAASRRPEQVGAVVSRGGRPDLAGPALANVRAPTLLLVGERDPEVLRMNESALERLDPRSKLVVIPGATHLFEEPGTLDQVVARARDWFLAWLRAPGERPRIGA